MSLPRRTPLPSSRRTRDFLSGRAASLSEEKKGEPKKLLTKSEERAKRALAIARQRVVSNEKISLAHKGISENPLRELERKERERHLQKQYDRGTSLARLKRYGNKEEEEEDLEFLQEIELDKSAAEAALGVASPLPRSVLRPRRVDLKTTHSLDDVPESEEE